MKLLFEKVPNRATMMSQSSLTVVRYQAVQSPGLPVPVGMGLVVTVGGIGRDEPKLAMQYQYSGSRPSQLPLMAGFQDMNSSVVM